MLLVEAVLPAGALRVEAQVPVNPSPMVQALAAVDDPSNFWSPSAVCGLPTPPPVTMATSSTEINSGATSASQQGNSELCLSRKSGALKCGNIS